MFPLYGTKMLLLLILTSFVNILAREDSIAMLRQGNQLLCLSSINEELMWQYRRMVAGKFQAENATTAFIDPDLTFQNISCQIVNNGTKVMVNPYPFNLHLNVSCSPGWNSYCVPNECSTLEECKEEDDFCLCSKNDTTPTQGIGPKPITDFDFYALNGSSADFRWNPPFSIGIIVLYKVTYQSYGKPPSFILLKPTPCTIWPWMHCTSINNLYVGEFYKFGISAKYNVSKWLIPATTRYLRLQTSTPDPPSFVRSYWDKYYKLTVEWQYPNKTNGVLELFQIDSNNTIYTIPVGNPHLNYSYSINYMDSLDTNALQVSIKCKNKDSLASKPFVMNVDCPPPTPKLKQQPVLMKIFQKSIEIGISQLNNARSESLSYVHLIVAKIPSEGDPKVHPDQTKFISQVIDLKPNMMAWIATEYRFSGNTSVNLTIGDMSKMFSNIIKVEITNWDLPQEVNLTIFIVVLNKRKEFLRYSRYYLEATLPKALSPFIYTTFLVLIIPIGLYCMYIVRKKKIRFVRI